MKKISAVWITGIFLLFISMGAIAQQVKTSFIEPERLLVSNNKTTNLIFAYAIKSVDRGTGDILVQKAIGVENVLQVKALRPGITETNLTVVTADGSLFSYIVNYTDNPGQLNIKTAIEAVTPQALAVFTADATTDVVAATAAKVHSRLPRRKGIKDRDHDMLLELKGIYIRENVLYFQLETGNYSNLDYDVQQLRFFIRDRKKSKRTSSQETELQPIYMLGDTDRIIGTSEHPVTVALPRITLPDKKFLIIQLLEEKGGRHLSLKISNKHLMRAAIAK